MRLLTYASDRPSPIVTSPATFSNPRLRPRPRKPDAPRQATQIFRPNRSHSSKECWQYLANSFRTLPPLSLHTHQDEERLGSLLVIGRNFEIPTIRKVKVD
jgi:hypothetical protein